VIGAIFNLIASILRLIPAWREKRVNNIEGEWKHNREAIERDLRGESWWVRNNDTSNPHNGDS
jgi:hypothetical protein|tara:strand:- start:817 stop:1005 length:189 start_codon:yes stop_codon:yes gene_type:complete